ncbi:hypothetical protein MFLAVUS_011048 [Mucor flavus]|uniref:Uncharacterized protein n=1 Tax=Mucor flavus TaxID=439312 RepID=A0ABP9ZEF3_9FUNG
MFGIEKFENRRLRLGFSMKTNDHMMQKTRQDMSNREKDLYPLYKNPFGITENDRIIGIDSGICDIVCGVDCDPRGLTNKQTTKQHSFAVSNYYYKMSSGMEWPKQKELKNRASSNIEARYDRLQTRKISRIIAQDYIVRVVLGRTKFGEDLKLTRKSSFYSRRKKRKLFRQQHQDDLRPNDDVRRTVVAYGDAISPLNICNLRKKKHRSSGLGENMAESRSTLKCYDEQNRILRKTSQYPERMLSGNRHWNRDVNAAANIRSVLVEYTRQDFNFNSRPTQLSRGQQDQGL